MKNFVFPCFLFLLFLCKFPVRDKKTAVWRDTHIVLLGYLELSALGRRQVPYEEIKNIELVGEGGQAEVYKGTLNEEIIALKRFVKKTKTEKYHLLGLDHPNLIRFLSVIYICFSSFRILKNIFIFKTKKNCIFWVFCSFSRLLKLCFIFTENVGVLVEPVSDKFCNDFQHQKIFQRCFFPKNELLCSNGVLWKRITEWSNS